MKTKTTGNKNEEPPRCLGMRSILKPIRRMFIKSRELKIRGPNVVRTESFSPFVRFRSNSLTAARTGTNSLLKGLRKHDAGGRLCCWQIARQTGVGSVWESS